MEKEGKSDLLTKKKDEINKEVYLLINSFRIYTRIYTLVNHVYIVGLIAPTYFMQQVWMYGLTFFLSSLFAERVYKQNVYQDFPKKKKYIYIYISLK